MHLEAATKILQKSSAGNRVVQTRLHSARARYLAVSGNPDYAEIEYKAVLVEARNVLGSHHPDVAKLLTEECDLEARRENLEEARRCYTEALKIAMEVLLPTHPLAIRLTAKARDLKLL